MKIGLFDRKNVIKQKELIENENWDNLIILDACRYDYFKKVSRKIGLRGNLKKVYSPASNSPEWCIKIFDNRKFEDVIVFSANPWLNSKIALKEKSLVLNPLLKNISLTFDGRKRFKKIYDVWDYGWDKEKGTVLPEFLSNEILKYRKKNSKSRLIAWYMQPHWPYLSLDYSVGSKRIGINKKRVNEPKFTSKLAGLLQDTVKRNPFFLPLVSLYLEMTNFPVEDAFGAGKICALMGKKKLRELYEDNLNSVLLSLLNVMENLDGKTVITSDHGELLGYEGVGHFPGSSKPNLHYVPWFIVDK